MFEDYFTAMVLCQVWQAEDISSTDPTVGNIKKFEYPVLEAYWPVLLRQVLDVCLSLWHAGSCAIADIFAP